MKKETMTESETISTVAVMAFVQEKEPMAKALALRLNLPFLSRDHRNTNFDYLLIVTDDYIGIQATKKNWAPFYVDFLSPQQRFRVKQASLRRELIAKAMGCHPNTHPLIVDATAGLGRDSYILAQLGFTVIMLEQSALIHTLLEDGLKRARLAEETAKPLQKLSLVHANAQSWLKARPPALQPDIILLDPMFPPRQKKASVKKEMVLLQQLVGTNADTSALLETALSCAKDRVVLKRPRLADVTGKEPSYSLTGKSARFDIYLNL